MITGYKKIFGWVLIFAGTLILLTEFKILSLEFNWIIGVSFILQGFFSVSISLNNNRRDLLFLFTVLFLIGMVFITKAQFNIRETRELIFTSILFITGGAFLMLFIDNSREKIWGLTSVIFLLAGYLSITLLREWGITKFANTLARRAEDFWPIVLIVSGIILFLNRKK